jgi:hypothetical protein
MNSVEELLKEYRDEINIAVSSFYTWKNFNNIASGNPEVRRALNVNALTWNIIAHSLQATFFATIGRIFDRDRRSLTLASFLDRCRAQVHEFSRSALETRRLQAANAIRPDYLSEYVSNAYEPVTADFDALIQSTRSYDQIYRANYEPIRHKVIAHRDLATIGNSESLFANTNIGEIEALLQFIYQVHQVVEQWYLNGRHTQLTDHALQEDTHVREDLESLLNRLAIQVALNHKQRAK